MPHRKFMERLNKADKLLQQFPHGIKAIDFARKLSIHRTQAYEYLNSLEVKGKAQNERGLWFPKDKKPEPKDEVALEYEKIKEDYLSGNTLKAFKRLELLADRLKVHPHPSELFSLAMKRLADSYGMPVDPLKELRLRRAVVRETLKRLDL